MPHPLLLAHKRAGNEPSRSFTITEKAPTKAFSYTSAFTVKTLLRHYAKLALTHGK